MHARSVPHWAAASSSVCFFLGGRGRALDKTDVDAAGGFHTPSSPRHVNRHSCRATVSRRALERIARAGYEISHSDKHWMPPGRVWAWLWAVVFHAQTMGSTPFPGQPSPCATFSPPPT